MAGMSRTAQLRRLARRAWPLILEAYRRWDNLSPQEKERYKRQVQTYAERARDIAAKRPQSKKKRGR